MRRFLCPIMILLALLLSISCAGATEGNENEEILSPLSMDASIDPSYGVGTSNTAIFSGIVQKLPYGTHYVYWRPGQYDYRLAYAEGLTLSGAYFTADTVTVVSYRTSNGYNSQATFQVSQESGFTLQAGSYLVYSDLGSYPQLYSREGVDYAKTACVILCSFGLFYLFGHLWSSVRQRRSD